MKLLIASNNAHKIREIREILSGVFPEICSLDDAGLSIDVVEDGETFEANAVKKAETVLRESGWDAALADDSGLCVDALGGAPGVHSARYAGDQHCDADNNEKLMRGMADVPDAERGCRFVSAVALARRGRETVCVRGTAEGILLHGPQGTNGCGYDPYFFYPPFGKSFAQIPPEQKNSVSHRRRALEALLGVLNAEESPEPKA